MKEVSGIKNKDRVTELIAALKAEIETPYELAAIERLENELTNGAPSVEVIDEKSQKLFGLKFYKKDNGHYVYSFGIHQLMYMLHYGEIPEGCQIHHIDFNPANNNIENLLPLTRSEHMKLHALTRRRQKQKFICENCGKEYEAFNNSHNRFCSDNCAQKYKYNAGLKHEIRKCEWCGKEFSTFKGHDTKCCSQSCGLKLALKTKGFKIRQIKKCQYCGKEFKSKKDDQKYCSYKCSGLAKSVNKIKKCEYCGKEFKYKKPSQRFCSHSCGTTVSNQSRRQNKET